MDDAAIISWLKNNPIKTPSDLNDIPLFETPVDFSTASGRRLDIMFTDYSFDSASQIPCGIKGCRKQHQHGFVVRSTDNKVTNIGRNCGKTHLGLDFTRLKKELSARRKASDNIESISEILRNLSKYSREIETLEIIAKALTSCAMYLKREAPTIDYVVRGMARKGNADIYKTETLKGRDAEIYLTQTRTRRADYVNGAPTKDVKVGSLTGIAFFRDLLGPIIRKEICTPIDSIRSLSEESISNLSPKQLSKLSLEAQAAIRSIPKAKRVVRFGIDFFSEENLSKLTLIEENPQIIKIIQFSIAQLLPLREN